VFLGDFNEAKTAWSIRNSLGSLLDLYFVINPDCVFLSKVAPFSQLLLGCVPIDTAAVLVEKSEKSTKRLHCFRMAILFYIRLWLVRSLRIPKYGWFYKCFYSTLNSLFHSCALLYYPSVSNKPPWFSKEL